MAGSLSPNPTMAQKQRVTLLSPSSPFCLGSNDDKLERAQARAARAAAIRRKAAPATAPHDSSDGCLDKQQIIELFHNCIKLASENKINQKNTWELSLIDHLHDIIKVEEEDDAETNFQKASCTLEAGVKIYSMRVDSVHSEAYKVLGGINRVGTENQQDGMVEDADNSRQEEGHVRKEQEKKLSPLSTLESSFEALNAKKIDVAFAIDPLYHQTSAKFDEGGAKGLLLNNLGVYGGCRVLFDSLEVPGKCEMLESQCDMSETIDISFARESIEQILLQMPEKDLISTSLQDIVKRFDESLSGTFCPSQKTAEQPQEVSTNDDGFDDFDASGNWNFDHDNVTSVIDESTCDGDPISSSHQKENEQVVFPVLETDDRFERVDDFLFLSLGLNAMQNAWAGPDHWKYCKVKGVDDLSRENQSQSTIQKPNNKNKIEHDLDFSRALSANVLHVFSPPGNPKSLLLPINRGPCNTMLPEDCHYQPEDLVKLFLLPNVMCVGRRTRKASDWLNQSSEDCEPLPSWDNESGFDDQFDGGDAYSEAEPNELVAQPRQVNKIDVQYDKTSKQVDVKALKETLWEHIHETNHQEEAISFRHVLATFPYDCIITASSEDISPHLCFMCLLHLANEHGLRINGCTNLDDLSIDLPPADNVVHSAIL